MVIIITGKRKVGKTFACNLIKNEYAFTYIDINKSIDIFLKDVMGYDVPNQNDDFWRVNIENLRDSVRLNLISKEFTNSCPDLMQIAPYFWLHIALKTLDFTKNMVFDGIVSDQEIEVVSKICNHFKTPCKVIAVKRATNKEYLIDPFVSRLKKFDSFIENESSLLNFEQLLRNKIEKIIKSA